MTGSAPRPSDEAVRASMRRWYVAMELSHTALMAGLRAEVGPDGDIERAYLRWNRRRLEIKRREYETIAERIGERGTGAKDDSEPCHRTP